MQSKVHVYFSGWNNPVGFIEHWSEIKMIERQGDTCEREMNSVTYILFPVCFPAFCSTGKTSFLTDYVNSQWCLFIVIFFPASLTSFSSLEFSPSAFVTSFSVTSRINSSLLWALSITSLHLLSHLSPSPRKWLNSHSLEKLQLPACLKIGFPLFCRVIWVGWEL